MYLCRQLCIGFLRFCFIGLASAAWLVINLFRVRAVRLEIRQLKRTVVVDRDKLKLELEVLLRRGEMSPEEVVNTGVADKEHPDEPIVPWAEPLRSAESYTFGLRWVSSF